MTPISGFIVISLITTIIYFLGFLIFITDNEQNRCEMTYMFQYPQLVKIETSFDWRFKKYGLYAYSEGILTERARRMHFDGIPILFIPGNGGSYKQVRSFASVALRKSLDDGPSFHFDYFALDLNDELSGFNGALLNEQTEYANLSIHRILELYSKNSRYKPTSVVIIGHSMGGIIARGLASILAKDTIVLLIITLATPHRRPPVALDTYMVDYYNKLEKVRSPNTTIVTLSGGYNDLLVTPFLTHMNDFEDIDVITTSVPLVWLPVDHRCILWCRQLVLTITRSLFELVDLNRKQIIPNKSHHIKVFRRHLIKNSGVKSPRSTDLATDFKKSEGDWIENLRQQYTISLINGTKKPQWHMIRLIHQPEYEVVTILTSNLKVEKWVFACAALYLQGQHRICKNGIDLSDSSAIVPSLMYKRRFLNINLHHLKSNDSQLTHIVMKVLPTNERLTIHVDRYNSNERTLNVDLPKWWSVTLHTILAKTNDKAVYYELLFPQLQHIVQSYSLYVTPVNCSSNTHHAVLNLHMPWSHQNVYKYVTAIERDPLNLRVYTSKPGNTNSSIVSVMLTLDPVCVYSIAVSNSFLGMLSQIARTYSPLLVANVGAVVILTLRNQLASIETTKCCSIFFVAIKQGVKPYYILTTVKLASRLLGWSKLSHILPVPDWQIIADEGNDFFFLPLILYICSVGLVWILALALGISLFLYESAFYRIASKFLAKTVTGVVKISELVISGFQKLPCCVALILIALCFGSCGALALCLGCGFYFLKLTHMSQEYMEDLLLKLLKYLGTKIKRKISKNQREESSNQVVTGVDETFRENFEIETNDANDKGIKNDKQKASTSKCSSEEVKLEREIKSTNVTSLYSGIFFHFSLFLLWCLVAGLNIPSILTWAHNFRISNSLQPDTSFVPGIILSVCAIPLWQMELPRPNLRWYKELGYILNVMAAASLIYAPISIYRLVYIITATFLIITLHQLFSPTQIEREEESFETSSQNNSKVLNDKKVKCE